MWGQVDINGKRPEIYRIIPTRVGTRVEYKRVVKKNGDHPHACGDKVSTTRLSVARAGSSPRVWGQGQVASLLTKVYRIIPTRVGTSCLHLSCLLHWRDHPHACGDKIYGASVLSTVIGSSPRVWGQVGTLLSALVLLGIIPTRVGTRCWWEVLSNTGKDHPHACGDKKVTVSRLNTKTGSSPRVWGQGRFYIQICPDIRIIPTRVGTSYASCQCLPMLMDHPHACGDKLSSAFLSVFFQGSSPRVWGQVIGDLDTSAKLGIIPTRVGTRLKKSRKIAVLQNQPLRFPLTFHRSFV